jgi:hypothetical protein
MRPKKVTRFPLKSRVSGIAGRLVEGVWVWCFNVAKQPRNDQERT